MAHAGQFDRRSTASFRSCAERIVLRSSIVWCSRHSQVMLTLLSTAAEAPLRGSPASLDSVQLEWLNEVQHLVADSSRNSLPQRLVWSYLGLFLLALYGVSELLAGIFPIDIGGEATTAGTIHTIVGNISFFCLPIAAILLSLRMGKDEQWRSIRRPALALSIVVVLTAILTIAGFNLGIGFGVTQRVANVAVLVWMLMVALHLRSVAQGALAQHPSRAS
jgi:hypothetical membrane protein